MASASNAQLNPGETRVKRGSRQIWKGVCQKERKRAKEAKSVFFSSSFVLLDGANPTLFLAPMLGFGTVEVFLLDSLVALDQPESVGKHDGAVNPQFLEATHGDFAVRAQPGCDRRVNPRDHFAEQPAV